MSELPSHHRNLGSMMGGYPLALWLILIQRTPSARARMRAPERFLTASLP